MNRVSLVARWLPLLCVTVVFFVYADVAWACPNCKDALAAHDPSGGGMVRGYFWSILLMLTMPFIILSGLGSYFYYLVRQARRTGQGWNPNTYQSGVHAS